MAPSAQALRVASALLYTEPEQPELLSTPTLNEVRRGFARLFQTAEPIFKSRHQQAAFDLIHSAPPASKIIGILPTGGGKSALYLSAAAAWVRGETTVVFLPLRLLTEQTLALGSTAVVIDRYSSSRPYQLTAAGPDGGLFVVPMENWEQDQDHLNGSMQRLIRRGKLLRIVCDEAHVVPVDVFRPALSHFSSLPSRYLNSAGCLIGILCDHFDSQRMCWEVSKR